MQYSNTTSQFEAMLLVLFLIPVIIFLILWILVSVWIGKQAKNRGMDNPTIWVLIAMLFPIAGWIVFAFLMPSGLSVPCDICGKKKLETLLKCPHCGYPSKLGETIQQKN
ncbi:MAG: hypothetical protein P9L94_16755 [Candidatus Hinthialibacter antarcticus]|nr:hypothetical protein [Candidatus Hinthialibacter antarcticus]